MDGRTQTRINETQAGIARGWQYTPLQGKAAYLAGWEERHDTPEQMLAWAQDGNVGLRTGTASGVDVIDLDGPAAARLDEFPPTWTVKTGKGFHLIYQHVPGAGIRNWNSEIGKHIDIKTTGGYVVAVGSIHPETGAAYQWHPGRGPGEVELAPFPVEMVQDLHAREQAQKQAKKRKAPATVTPAPSRRKGYVTAALDEETSKVANAPEGEGNATINAAAFNLGQLVAAGQLSEGEVVQALTAATAHWSARDGRDGTMRSAIQATIQSGLRAGMRSPRPSSRLPRERTPAPEADLSGILEEATPAPAEPPVEVVDDETLFSCPGFVDAFIEHCLATVRYTDRRIAFAGGLAMQALLCGRCVQDPSGIRSNIYLTVLADPSLGKDGPRKVIDRIAEAAGMPDGHIEKTIASGEGLEDKLAIITNLLVLADEIPTLFERISKDRDGRQSWLVHLLLTIYTSSDGRHTPRMLSRRGRKEQPPPIHNPSLTLFGTGVAEMLFSCMNEAVLLNGLFARFQFITAGSKKIRRDTKPAPVPAALVDMTRAWLERWPGINQDTFPTGDFPPIAPYGPGAEEAANNCEDRANVEYNRARKPSIRNTWGRTNEHAKKYALLRACSRSATNPIIEVEDVEWGWRLASTLTRQVLASVDGCIAVSIKDQDRVRVMKCLRMSGGRASWSDLLTSTRILKRPLEEILETMIESGEVKQLEVPTKGRTRKEFHLV